MDIINYSNLKIIIEISNGLWKIFKIYILHETLKGTSLFQGF